MPPVPGRPTPAGTPRSGKKHRSLLVLYNKPKKMSMLFLKIFYQRNAVALTVAALFVCDKYVIVLYYSAMRRSSSNAR